MNQREAIMRLLEAAVDDCLQEAEDRRYGEPRTFMADMRLVFTHVPSVVVKCPVLDFSQIIEPQIRRKMQEISVNGQTVWTTEPELTYEDVVRQVGGNPEQVWRITCRAAGLEDSILSRGMTIQVARGLIINAAMTTNG